MLAWLAPIVVFGLVVFVHELGHFLAAKASGVYAPRFSIGFGPALWRRRAGETEYVIAALPLGGYVRMASREDEATAFLEGGSEEEQARQREASGEGWDPNAMMPFGPKPVPSHRWFESKALPTRLFILAAGVTMNAVLAIVLSITVNAVYGRPYHAAVVDSIVPGNPAEKAGLQRGDSITAVNGQPVREWSQVLERVSKSAGVPLRLDFQRNGSPRSVTLVPELRTVKDPATGEDRQAGRIGAAARDELLRQPLSFGESVVAGWTETWRMAGGIVQIVRGLVTGGVSARQLGGPIQIARVSVEAARGGLEQLMLLIAFLSINVAVLNLLPVPILDGGQILLNVLEAAKGSAFSARTREYILRAGLVAIALLFALVMFNDLRGMFS